MTIPNLLEPHLNRGNKGCMVPTSVINHQNLPPSLYTHKPQPAIIVSLPTFIHVIPTPFSNTHLSHPLSGMTFDRRRTIFKPVIKTSSELLKNKTVQKHNDAITKHGSTWYIGMAHVPHHRFHTFEKSHFHFQFQSEPSFFTTTK